MPRCSVIRRLSAGPTGCPWPLKVDPSLDFSQDFKVSKGLRKGLPSGVRAVITLVS